MLNQTSLIVLVTLFISTLVADAVADPPAVTGAANQNMVAEFKGTLKSFQRGVLMITRDDGTEVMVYPPEDPSRFQFVATAKPAFMRRGMLVRFKGTFNQVGVSLSPVTRVELFQPVSGKLAGHARERFVPGVYSSERHARNQPPQAVAQYNIVGAVTGLDPSGLMAVQAGKHPVRVQLSPDVKLEVRFNNLSLAQEGDPVSVAGFYQPPDDTKIKADQVTITTDRVYGEPTEQPNRRNRGRRTRRGEDKDEEEAKQGEAEEGEGDRGEEAAADADGAGDQAEAGEAGEAAEDE